MKKLLILLFISVFLFFGFSTSANSADQKELFFVAQKAFDDGFYDVAIRYIEQFITEYPQSPKLNQAKILLGQCYFFKNQYLKAYDTFQSVPDNTELQDAKLYWLGETYLKGADYTAAEKQYLKILEVFPNSEYRAQTHYSLGWTYYELTKYPLAKTMFMKLLQQHPESPLVEDSAFKIGECAYNSGDHEAAIEYFKGYILEYPYSTRHSQAYFYIGEAYYFKEDFLTASTYYAKASDIAYDQKLELMSKISLGWCYLKLQRFELSQKIFEEASQLAKQRNTLTDDIFLGQATLYSEMKEYKKAVEAYTQLIEKFPDSPRVPESRLGRANNLYALKDYAKAIQEYEKIISDYTGDRQKTDFVEKGYFGLSWTYLKAGEIDQAIANFEKIMDKTESKIVKISALTQIGDAYQDVERYEEAIQIYDRILKDFPDSVYTDYIQFRQGIALLKSEKVEGATISFKNLETNFPTSKHIVDVKYFLGLAYFKKDDWSTANDYMDEYLQLAGNESEFSPEAHYIIGLCAFNTGQFKEAVKAFQGIIKKFPSEQAIIKNSELSIAKSLYKLGDPAAAIENFKAIAAKYPTSEVTQESLIWLGNYYLETGKYSQAAEYFDTILTRFPGGKKLALANFGLGQAHEAMQKFDEALKYYKSVNKHNPHSELSAKANLSIAAIFSKELNLNTAIETYNNIIQQSPEFQRDAYVKIAEVHKTQRRYPEALENYKKALKSNIGLSRIQSAEIQFYIADIYEVLNEPSKAVEEYLKIPYLYGDNLGLSVKAYLRSARIFEDSEQWNDAVVTYNKIKDLKTDESKYAQERLDWINQNILPTTQN